MSVLRGWIRRGWLEPGLTSACQDITSRGHVGSENISVVISPKPSLAQPHHWGKEPHSWHPGPILRASCTSGVWAHVRLFLPLTQQPDPMLDSHRGWCKCEWQYLSERYLNIQNRWVKSEGKDTDQSKKKKKSSHPPNLSLPGIIRAINKKLKKWLFWLSSKQLCKFQSNTMYYYRNTNYS